MATVNAKISFNPVELTEDILNELNERSKNIVTHRFGLNKSAQRKTLEAIGQEYGITRERVRQIENAALSSIRKSTYYQAEADQHLSELKETIAALGGIVAEDDLLQAFSSDRRVQNHIHFYLTLGDYFTKHKEDAHFKPRWSVDNQVADQIHDALKNLYKNLQTEDLIPETEIIERFLDEVKHKAVVYRDAEIARRWLNISKKISRNPLDEWGRAESANVRTRGVKDYAYLAMRKHGSPLHFREVADVITDTFGKQCHAATCHNELIKDDRFVLVGRGVYALKDWGYKEGVAREVIRDILAEEGPMTKEAIIDRVMKERYFKRNTILVNLHNPKYFKRLPDGRYTTAKK